MVDCETDIINHLTMSYHLPCHSSAISPISYLNVREEKIISSKMVDCETDMRDEMVDCETDIIDLISSHLTIYHVI